MPNQLLHEQIDQTIAGKQDWTLRRQLGIPNNKRLWVLVCIDERLPYGNEQYQSQNFLHKRFTTTTSYY